MRIPRRCAALFLILFNSAVGVPASTQGNNDCGARKIPQLVDVTTRSGVKFVHTSAPEKKYIVESMSGGVLLVDYDRDGWQDIFFTNAPTVEMALKGQRARSGFYHNNRDGTFTDITDRTGVGYPGFAMGGAAGDYNNDGWPDIYVTCLGGNVLYRNNGNGTFSDVTKTAGVADGRWSAGAAFGDYNRDGFLDLFVANYVDFKLSDLPSFGSSPTCKFRGIDVQCGPRGLKGAGDSLFRNNGDGTFTDVTKETGTDDSKGYYGMGVVWADFNNRGRLDAFVANDSTANSFYRNDVPAKFAEIGLESGTGVSGDGSEQGSMGIAVGDYLHSGRLAIFVTNFADEYNTLYRNDGNYDFADVSMAANVAQASRPYVGWGTGFFDLDNDGWLDLLVVNGHVYPQIDTLPSGARYRQHKLLHINQTNGTFCDASRQAGAALMAPRASRGAAFGDLDNDGHLDVVVNDLDGPPMILRNEGGDGNHWITLELGTTIGNRLAIGARIKIVSGDLVQIEEVRSGGSYLSQNDLRIHFGTGKYTKVDTIEIRWPSGKTELIKDLITDKFYSILEGEGVVPAARLRPGAKPSK